MSPNIVASLCVVGWAAAAGTLVHADPLTVTKLTPQRQARHICTDTPLYITFNQQPVLGTTGTIRVYQSNDTLFDTIDLADPNSRMKTIGGSSAIFTYFPVIINGNMAAIYLHKTFANHETYYVLIDPGVFSDPDGDPFPGIQQSHRWRFSTRVNAPPAGATHLTVSADGAGDFCTVQGAIDHVPDPNSQAVTIDVRTGVYTEIVYIKPSKPFITVRGESRDNTVIQYTNNNNMNPHTNIRPVFDTDASDFILEDITIHNTTPKGGSQAEAFRGNNLRILLNRVNLKSFQDTLLLQGKGFVTNSYIEGDVDFMWGSGEVFIENSELKALNPGYYTQIRNPLNSTITHGFVYVNCVLDRNPGLGDNTMYLARIDPNVFPFSQVVWINSAMDAHVMPAGWELDNANCSGAPNVQFWEYRSTDLKGSPIDVSHRLACSAQLTDQHAAQWSDPSFVLDGWVPSTVNAGPESVATGDAIAVNWSAPLSHAYDWVGLYRVGTADTDYISWQYVPPSTTGTLTFMAPDERGRYEFRYFLNDGYTLAATSNAVSVGKRM